MTKKTTKPTRVYKIRNKFEDYKATKGKVFTKPSLTDESQAAEADIYHCLEKYGMQTLINQTMAKEPLYLDLTNKPKDLAEAVRLRNEMDEYFKELPAKARKVFGDSTEVFYQKYKNGEFNQFAQTGVFTNEQIEALTSQYQTEQNKLSNYDTIANENATLKQQLEKLQANQTVVPKGETDV